MDYNSTPAPFGFGGCHAPAPICLVYFRGVRGCSDGARYWRCAAKAVVFPTSHFAQGRPFLGVVRGLCCSCFHEHTRLRPAVADPLWSANLQPPAVTVHVDEGTSWRRMGPAHTGGGGGWWRFILEGVDCMAVGFETNNGRWWRWAPIFSSEPPPPPPRQRPAAAHLQARPV